MKMHDNKGKRGVRVYFLMGGAKPAIASDVVEKTVGDRVIFYGGNWCHKADCYLTARQCRRAHGLNIDVGLRRTRAIVANSIDRLDSLLANIDEQLEGK